MPDPVGPSSGGWMHVHPPNAAGQRLSSGVIAGPDGRIIGTMACMACMYENASAPDVDEAELAAVTDGVVIPDEITDEDLERWMNGDSGA